MSLFLRGRFDARSALVPVPEGQKPEYTSPKRKNIVSQFCIINQLFNQSDPSIDLPALSSV
jgi:hypothetical protein